MRILTLCVLGVVLCSCKQPKKETQTESTNTEKPSEEKVDFTIVFASCNDQNRAQPLWKPILENKPDVFIWGGDNIYADTDDMQKMKADYDKVLSNPDYKKLMEATTVIGTWDDHDYGKNDAGVEWEKKAEAQQELLDFLKIPQNDSLRTQEGVYYTQKYTTPKGSVKVILLDTRTFRDSLKKSTVEGWRFEPWEEGKGGTVLGDTQWAWLEAQLNDTDEDFTLIVSSIQFLADEHGWEKWGNFPMEMKRMDQVLANAKAKNILLVSGDRHLGEFSVKNISGLSYPLVDFTTSGLTHTYPESPDTPNRYRKGKIVKDLNFGVLQFNFETKKVIMELKGKENSVLESLKQQY